MGVVSRYSCADESRALPGSSQVVILIVVTLVSNYQYHDNALILTEFLFMKLSEKMKRPNITKDMWDTGSLLKFLDSIPVG